MGGTPPLSWLPYYTTTRIVLFLLTFPVNLGFVRKCRWQVVYKIILSSYWMTLVAMIMPLLKWLCQWKSEVTWQLANQSKLKSLNQWKTESDAGDSLFPCLKHFWNNLCLDADNWLATLRHKGARDYEGEILRSDIVIKVEGGSYAQPHRERWMEILFS